MGNQGIIPSSLFRPSTLMYSYLMIKGKFWVPDIIGRFLSFLFFLVVYSFLLYFLGNYQDFLDATQNVLLKILESAGLIYIILCLFFIAARIIEWVVEKKRPGKDLLISFIGMLISGFLVVAAEFILVIS